MPTQLLGAFLMRGLAVGVVVMLLILVVALVVAYAVEGYTSRQFAVGLGQSIALPGLFVAWKAGKNADAVIAWLKRLRG